jgi:chromate transporter
VLGIIVHALLRIGSRVLRTPFALVLAVLAGLALGVLHLPFPVVVLGAGVVGLATSRFAPRWLPAPEEGHAGDVATTAPTASMRDAVAIAALLLVAWWLPLLALRGWLGADSTAWAMGLFFSKAALVTIGGAYAVLPYVAQQAVEVHGWLGAEQMLVGLGLAESTPGPLIMVLEFAGFVGGWQHSCRVSCSCCRWRHGSSACARGRLRARCWPASPRPWSAPSPTLHSGSAGRCCRRGIWRTSP